MSNAKFTPGPWRRDYIPPFWVRSPLHDNIATIDKTGFSIDESSANANLIVAAPELYEALESILEIGKRDMSNPKYDAYFQSAHAALAKARGESIPNA